MSDHTQLDSSGPEDDSPSPFHGRRWADDETTRRISSFLAVAASVFETGTADLATLHGAAVEADEILRQCNPNRGNPPSDSSDPGPFTAFIPDIEARHARLRDLIAHLSRPHLRPLRLTSLPPEILAIVVAHCEGGANHQNDDEDDDDSNNNNPETVAAIRNLRVTNRALASLAAPHLIRTLDVSLTPSSLARLDAVSHHPTISTGVLRLRVSLASHPPRLAADLASFVRSAFRRLSREAKRDDRARRLAKPDADKHAARTREWIRNGAGSDFLVRAFTEFARRRDVHEAVRAARLGSRVADAVARMRNVRAVRVDDEAARPPWHEKYPARSEDDPLVDEEALLELVTLPMRWEAAAAWEAADKSDHPVEVLRDILVALGKREVPLTRLDVKLTPPARYDGLSCTEAEREDIQRAVRGLRSVDFEVKPSRDVRDEFDPPAWPPRGPAELAALGGFMSAALASPALEVANLDFGALRRENQDLWALDALLRSAPEGWPRLRRLTLHHPCLRASDLKTLVVRSERLAWLSIEAPHLSEGSWAEVLEMLHGRTDPRRRERGETPMKTPTGGEAEDMSFAQYDSVFSEPRGWTAQVEEGGEEAPMGEGRRLSAAMRYVLHLQAENPLYVTQ
ncbi:hypothetical protein CH63R_13202 [Colletotrichum higginsianum IMI 349063]|uniref:Uncharacterized protein n=2 Tax=Colletotrichum higginsianum (strain IMI 349063) TaxID=759273 RepID=A0A1B7XWE7_COLHI|nr:hypothetical protein CH63R_13202 [Colletotrichum higginsianum IMI 349063]OBR04075.1 hypothetical protein CH63R_13202 [Colletotrichum higginsianum IMI 349063]